MISFLLDLVFVTPAVSPVIVNLPIRFVKECYMVLQLIFSAFNLDPSIDPDRSIVHTSQRLFGDVLETP